MIEMAIQHAHPNLLHNTFVSHFSKQKKSYNPLTTAAPG
jgi:hypothetical protein